MSLRRIVALRHGRTAWNATGRMQGRLDPELDDLGRRQAAAAAPGVAGFAPRVVVASDQLRAWATAAAVGAATGLDPRPDPRLRETSVGEWEGLDAAEVDAGWPGARTAWRADATYAPPGGESRVAVSGRALAVVHDLAQELHHDDGPDGDGATALVVAHGGTIAAITGGLLGWPVTVWPTLQPLRNCHWAVLEHRPETWRLVAWNVGVAAPPE